MSDHQDKPEAKLTIGDIRLTRRAAVSAISTFVALTALGTWSVSAPAMPEAPMPWIQGGPIVLVNDAGVVVKCEHGGTEHFIQVTKDTRIYSGKMGTDGIPHKTSHPIALSDLKLGEVVRITKYHVEDQKWIADDAMAKITK